jgi:hypothetical protein
MTPLPPNAEVDALAADPFICALDSVIDALDAPIITYRPEIDPDPALAALDLDADDDDDPPTGSPAPEVAAFHAAFTAHLLGNADPGQHDIVMRARALARITEAAA